MSSFKLSVNLSMYIERNLRSSFFFRIFSYSLKQNCQHKIPYFLPYRSSLYPISYVDQVSIVFIHQIFSLFDLNVRYRFQSHDVFDFIVEYSSDVDRIRWAISHYLFLVKDYRFLIRKRNLLQKFPLIFQLYRNQMKKNPLFHTV